MPLPILYPASNEHPLHWTTSSLSQTYHTGIHSLEESWATVAFWTLEYGWADRYVYVYYPRQPNCLSCCNIPGDRGSYLWLFFLTCNTRGISYIIMLHLVDASMLTIQRWFLKHFFTQGTATQILPLFFCLTLESWALLITDSAISFSRQDSSVKLGLDFTVVHAWDSAPIPNSHTQTLSICNRIVTINIA